MNTNKTNNQEAVAQPNCTLSKLYAKHYESWVSFAEKLLGTNLYAQDTVQDVFMQVYQQDLQFITDTIAIRYIYRSIYNKCIDSLRRKQIIRKHEEIFLRESQLNLPSVNHEILYNELSSIVEKRIDALPPKCRQIFCMKFRKDQTNPDISSELGLSLKTVENQIFIARNALRKHLSPYLCS